MPIIQVGMGGSYGPYISGPSAVCSNSTFTFNNVPTGCSVSWSQSINLSYVSGQNTNSYVVMPNGNGNGWVQATIIGTPCGSVILPKFNVLVGAPIINSIIDQYGSPITPGSSKTYCTKQYCTFTANAVGGSTYNWNLSPLLNNSFSWSGNMAWASLISPQYYTLSFSESNSCGTATYNGNFIVIPCGYSSYSTFSISPNPASSNVTLTKTTIIDSTATSKSASLSANDIVSTTATTTAYTIKILNSFGSLYYEAKKNGDSFTIPVNNLPDGSYIVEINDGKNSYKQHLIIKH
jgi:hypothetical protein